MTVLKKICICCPAGCHLEITRDADGALHVAGNACPRGTVYGETEATDPRRIVTAVVRTDSREFPYIPVKTCAPLPIKEIPGLLRLLYSMEIPLPERSGVPILRDYAHTGIDIVCTRGVKHA